MTDEIDTLRRNLAATEEALLDCTDRMERTRALLRNQILDWHADGFTWEKIKSQPAAQAYYGPVLGS